VIHKYECTMSACGVRITLDDEKLRQDSVYPKGRGPADPNYRPHNCPLTGFMFPVAETIAKHPLAKKVS
jgi:hypothetical protein